jgi:DNA (cytosine-5)-methyltransferase 1
MKVSSLPDDWNIPDWARDELIRHVIGEGIPPLMIKKIVYQIKEMLK